MKFHINLEKAADAWGGWSGAATRSQSPQIKTKMGLGELARNGGDKWLSLHPSLMSPHCSHNYKAFPMVYFSPSLPAFSVSTQTRGDGIDGTTWFHLLLFSSPTFAPTQLHSPSPPSNATAPIPDRMNLGPGVNPRKSERNVPLHFKKPVFVSSYHLERSEVSITALQSSQGFQHFGPGPEEHLHTCLARRGWAVPIWVVAVWRGWAYSPCTATHSRFLAPGSSPRAEGMWCLQHFPSCPSSWCRLIMWHPLLLFFF